MCELPVIIASIRYSGLPSSNKEGEYFTMLYIDKILTLLTDNQQTPTQETILAACDGDVNAVDTYSLTFLHWAVKTNRLDIVQLLLELNSNINARRFKSESIRYNRLLFLKTSLYSSHFSAICREAGDNTFFRKIPQLLYRDT
jgi:ankyrin repeat protein